MPEADQPETETLDATGLLCPEPVIRVSRRVRDLASGSLLQVLVDDPLAELDLRVFCERTGHAFVGIDTVQSDGESEVQRIIIRCR